MRNVIVFVAVLFVALVSLKGQAPMIFNGRPALEFVSEEGTSRIVFTTVENYYPALSFSGVHFHVIGQCDGSIIVSRSGVQFIGSGDHRCGASRVANNGSSTEWRKDKKGRDCIVLRQGGQTDRVALAVTNPKGKSVAPIVWTAEMAKLRTWFADALADFDETYDRFRKLTER